MNIDQQFNAVMDRLKKTVETLPQIIANEAVNFMLDNFQKQGFQGDEVLLPWAKRKNPNAWGKPDDTGRALLIKSGRGRRSIRIGAISRGRVSILVGGQ